MSKVTRHLPVSLGLLCAGALGLAALTARSQPAPGTSTAAASGAATASGTSTAAASGAATASGTAASAPAPPVLRGADIPVEASEAPKDKKDWEPARVVSPNKGSAGCVFKVLREWLRIECELRIGAALVAGEPADVKVWSWGEPMAALSWNQQPGAQKPQAVMVLPLRRGESYLLDLVMMTEGGWDWVGPGRAEQISVSWRGSSKDPLIHVVWPF